MGISKKDIVVLFMITVLIATVTTAMIVGILFISGVTDKPTIINYKYPLCVYRTEGIKTRVKKCFELKEVK